MNKYFFCLLAFFALVSCKEKSSGYADMDELYKESMVALQTKDLDKIKEYVDKVLPDDGTIAAMKKMDFHYRGLPEELKEQPDGLKLWRENFAKRLYNLSAELEMRGILKDLKFIGYDEDYKPEDIGQGMEKTDVLFAEPFGQFGCPQDTIEYKIGELLKINGVWKSFTEAKL